MLEINVAHGVVVSRRKGECRGKACQEGNQEEIHIFDLNIKFLGL